MHEAFSGSGNANIKGKFAIRNAVMNVTFQKMGKVFVFHVPSEGNSRAAIQSATSHLFNDPPNFSFEMEFKQPDDSRRNVAFLAAAYLSNFKHFGYEYLIFCGTQCLKAGSRIDLPASSLVFPQTADNL